jgi:hypothetical protein
MVPVKLSRVKYFVFVGGGGGGNLVVPGTHESLAAYLGFFIPFP